MPNKLSSLRQDMEVATYDLERLINATPTGERRNKLTEANIHLIAVIDALVQAEKQQS